MSLNSCNIIFVNLFVVKPIQILSHLIPNNNMEELILVENPKCLKGIYALILFKLIVNLCNFLFVVQIQILKSQVAKVALQNQLAVKSHHCSTLEKRKPTLILILVSKGTFKCIPENSFINYAILIFYLLLSKINTNSKSSYPKQQYGGTNSGVQRYYQSFQIKINISTSKSVYPSVSSPCQPLLVWTHTPKYH